MTYDAALAEIDGQLREVRFSSPKTVWGALVAVRGLGGRTIKGDWGEARKLPPVIAD